MTRVDPKSIDALVAANTQNLAPAADGIDYDTFAKVVRNTQGGNRKRR